MRRAPSHSLLGPALLLYLVADAAAAQGQLDVPGALVAAVAGLLSLTALRVARVELAGSQRTGWLGLAAACGLLRAVAPDALSLRVDLVQALGSGACAALIADLAISVPDRFGAAARARALRAGSYALGALAALLGVVTQAPALHAFGRLWLLPAWLGLAPGAALALALCVALGLRALRRRAGSSPEALASNAWALLGLVPAVGVALVACASALLGAERGAAPLRLATAASAGLLVWSHLRLCDPGQRLRVGPTTRDALAALLTLGALAAASALLRPLWPEGPLALAAAVGTLLLLAAALYRTLRELARVALAPASGRLLLALERGHAELAEVSDLLDVARVVLGAARSASGSVEAEPVLYVLDPELELRIDAAGQPHAAQQPLHPRLRAALRERPGEVIMRLPLQAQIVRQPALRPLIDALRALDALCVLPLMQRGELEGALVVPLGVRRSSLALEEIEALHRFGRHVAGFLGVLCAEARAFRRGSQEMLARAEVEQRLSRAHGELGRLQAELRAAQAGDATDGAEAAAVEVAYSPAMRGLLERLERVAPSAAPLLLEAEGGTPLLPLVRLLHHAGRRGQWPLVIGRCASARAGRGAAALLGPEHAAGVPEQPLARARAGAPVTAAKRLAAEPGGGQTTSVQDRPPAAFGETVALADPADPGWLQLAGEGTLLLCDLPALEPAVQRALAQRLADCPARVVASCRRDPERLLAEGALLPELRACFGPCVRVPPLRERAEDLPSLLLLALDHGARVLGRAPVGLEPDAQARLLGYDWPGNLDELYAVIEQAVARCHGPRVTLRELPRFGATPASPLDGTLERVERRVLRRALERADGNKSEAARLLGLKRTTFLDKLRRHGLEDGGKPRTSGAAAN